MRGRLACRSGAARLSHYPRASSGRWDCAGFTLVELTVVLVIIVILAVVAIPRLNVGMFGALGFYDEAQATIRFAQKSAVAMRRTVCLSFSATTVTLNYSANRTPVSCTSDLVSPRGTTPFVVIAASGIAFSPTPANFSFDGLGRPSVGQTINVIGDGTRSFTVEAETGYVHP